ncbi:unnamed protein product [Diplocarpon coronariae]|uniref:Uncharacterized protein n=1 Tax=Diplocarpon coronariae TaxID=2795749 RepID=A0A218Z5Z0_9HELO|nr:hypothetical protein JHW43_004724 [Diplocarpon mali]OWP03418.1 hypothetical protein B2J93_7436 [Marssonina coronariae]
MPSEVTVLDQQAALLQDLARDRDATSIGEDNGDFDYLFESDGETEAYPVPGLEDSSTTGHLGLDDPAALPESFANFPLPLLSPVETRTISINDQFESLLKAAATAGEQDAGWDCSQVGESFMRFEQSETYNIYKTTFGAPHASQVEHQKRKRDVEDPEKLAEPDKGPKRRKKTTQEDIDQLARERAIWGPEDGEQQEDSMIDQHLPVSDTGVRAADLHSATALFRRPSAASKKYTRAPMSKLFTSLELSAENFLHLQGAAKTYMLDERYPERSECVGSRGKADSDMTKLKLFACVKSFLEDDGWGERCFSEQSENGDVRKLKWPQMKNKIISLVTPLMRRMVTNERQRLYALETRLEKRTKMPITKRGQASVLPADVTNHQEHIEHIGPPGLRPTTTTTMDPKLDEYYYSIEPRSHTNENLDPLAIDAPFVVETPTPCDDMNDVKFHVNIVQCGRRLQPQVTLTSSSCPGFFSLVQHIHSLMDTGTKYLSSIEILGPSGMLNVKDEESWRDAIASVQQIEWMDGEMKCVVAVLDKE